MRDSVCGSTRSPGISRFCPCRPRHVVRNDLHIEGLPSYVDAEDHIKKAGALGLIHKIIRNGLGAQSLTRTLKLEFTRISTQPRYRLGHFLRPRFHGNCLGLFTRLKVNFSSTPAIILPDMLETFVPFIVGLTGSLHCLGMCGPLVMAWSLRYRAASCAGSGNEGFSLFSGAFLHHLAFHAGRIFTYGVLGAIVAGIFGSFGGTQIFDAIQGGLCRCLRTRPHRPGSDSFSDFASARFCDRLLSPQAPVLGKQLARLTNSGSPGSKLGLGLLVGLLPCGLTWAMLVAAASTLSTFRGFVTMVSFGLGTIPALLAAGMSVSLVSARTRLFGERAAAIFIILMGALLAVRGLGAILGFGDNCCPMEFLVRERPFR